MYSFGTTGSNNRSLMTSMALGLTLILCLLTASEGQKRRTPCPAKCLCFSTTVRCMFLQLDHIPKVPQETTILDLRFNRIRNIHPNSFLALRNLNTLLLNNNHISRLQNGAFDGLENLRYLYLYKNRIRHIESEVFKKLPRLEQLYLHFNDLGSFGKNIFMELPKLERLFLHNNRLRNIPRGAFRNLPSLKRLRLDSNALVCDCQLLWLANMVKEKGDRTQVAATCEYPVGLQGKSLTSLTDTEFECKGYPEIKEGPSDVEVNFGGTAYFTCKVDGDPPPNVVWLHNNEVISSNHRYSILDQGSTLMIENAQKDDMGFYECRAINKMGEVFSRKAQIHMADEDLTSNEILPILASKPKLLKFPVDTNATLGTGLKLSCLAQGTPQPDISWTHENQPIQADQRIKITDDGSIVISSVEQSDTGTYQCQAANHLGRDIATAKLTIHVAPTLTKGPIDQYSEVGGTVEFSCDADGVPQPFFSWLKNGQQIQPTPRFNIFVGGQRLRIQNVKQSDEGQISCLARNSVGTQEATASLVIKEYLAPVIEEKPSNITALTGESIKMPCRYHGLPKPVVSWRKNGHAMSGGSKHKIDSDGSLKVYNVTSEDGGVYECVVANYVGFAVARASLTVSDPPVPVPTTPPPPPPPQTAPSSHVGDEFFEESFLEASEKVNKAVNDTISSLFNTKRNEPPRPHELLRIFRFPHSTGRELARAAETIEQTIDIVWSHVQAGTQFNISEFVYEDLLSPRKLRLLTDISGCLSHRKPLAHCDNMCFHKKYRTLDGTCNNLQNPMWGASLTGFRRELNPIYENGFNTPVGWSKTKTYHGFVKPSSRLVSTKLLSSSDVTPDTHCTHMLMQWGQFLDHDIDHALPAVSTESFKTGIHCQRSCDHSPPCFPIDIPQDDQRVRSHTCMEFTRSSPVCGSGTTSVFFDKLKPREQINQLTSFIDASQIYTSSNIELRSLRNRTSTYGELRHGIFSASGKPLLPFSNGAPIDCRRDYSESAIDCFLGGDVRANEQVGLTSMHTIFFREHNRIAEELHFINSHWDSDTIFHETRKIIGAFMQHITYTHWLPHIIGPGGMEKLGQHKIYDASIDPSIANVFATAGFRFGHTLINPIMQRLNSAFEPIPEGPLPLHKAFFSPWRIVQEGGIDPILRGLFTSPAKTKKDGQFMNRELTEKLFESAHEIALDLAAMNVQRGRDHGLPGYTEWRKFCGLSVPEDFDQLSLDITSSHLRNTLKELYGHPGNVDLFVGILLEDPIDGGRVGPTASCLLIDQFRRLRDGDRLWYTNPWVFKPEQLYEIQKVTLGRLLCNDGDDITDVTENVFILPQVQDKHFVSCSEIHEVDLRLWAECCTDCRNAGFFSSIERSITPNRRFRRDAQHSYPEDKNLSYDELDEDPSLISNSIFPNASYFNLFKDSTEQQSFKPQRRNDRFLSGPFEDNSEVGPAERIPEDPLEGYEKDVTEERIEGIEALVEQLSKTVQALSRKVKRLEKTHGFKSSKKGKTCIDEEGKERNRGDVWYKGHCIRCICKRGVRCRSICTEEENT